MSKFWDNFLSKWVFKDEIPKIEPRFQSLTPTDDAKEIVSYSNAMNHAFFNDKSIKNIAVTGQYGSGKSSFLRTYFKDKKDVLWVSLALFLDSQEEKKDIEKFEYKLELSILQQLFYVKKESRLWIYKIIGIIIFLLIGILGINQAEFFLRKVPLKTYSFIANHSITIFWVSFLVLIAVLSYALYCLLLFFKSLNVKRINVNGAGLGELGIELPDSKSFSILNRNVSKIINFFVKTKYSTVVFEDIDRFDDLRIFTKLRELNLLLNNSSQISSKKKPIRFIYALREDLFVDERSKVKFFDLVIPIIPRINASNSRVELLEFFSDKKQSKSLSRFVKEVSPYLCDMRLLKNICNEYQIYYEQIGDITSEIELLALIIFKNFFPKEFASMHEGEGLMYKLLSAKRKAQMKLKENVETQIRKLKNEVENIKNEKILDIKKLQELYYVTLMKKISDGEPFVYLENRTQNASSIIHNQNWFNLLRENKIFSNNYSRNSILWSDIEKSTDPSCTYEEHVRLIESKGNGRIDEISREIQTLQLENETIKRKTIKELIAEDILTKEDLKNIASETNIEGKHIELIFLMLKKGYLNENYFYNISIFREVDGVKSFSDYIFELNVTRGENGDWERNLNNAHTLVESLDLNYFATPSIMNYKICGALLSNPHSEKARAFWKFVSEDKKQNYEFIDGCIRDLNNKDSIARLFSCIMDANSKYFHNLVVNANADNIWTQDFLERQLGLFIEWTLSQDNVIKLSTEVKEFIEKTSSFPRVLKENGIVNSEDFCFLVKNFNLKFKELNCQEAKDIGFLDVLISENAYTLNENMIHDILEASGKSVENFYTKNYSVVRQCNIGQLVSYIDAEFKTYLDNVYLHFELQQQDDLETILYVLNNEDITSEEKESFINKQLKKESIKDTRQITSVDALEVVVKFNWITPSWENAFDLWNRSGNSKSLFWSFVANEEVYSSLSKKGSCRYEWKKLEPFVKILAEEEKLSDEALAALLSGLSKGSISKYSGENATPKRLKILLDGKRITYSKNLYQMLRQHDNDSHIALAAICIFDFCADYDSNLLNANVVGKILKSEFLHRKNIPLVSNTFKNIILSNHDLKIELASMINIGNYNQFDEKLLYSLVTKVKPESLQCKIIQHIDGSIDEVRDLLKNMPEPYNKLGELRCRPSIPSWYGLDKFLEFLKDKGIVSSFSLAEDGKMVVNTTRS